MPKSLVVVESPAKAKTINKFLGRNYIVKASMGHIRDLPTKELGVDVNNGFTPMYTVIRGKKKTIKELQSAARDVEAIYLAADLDREGEAICWHLKHELEKIEVGDRRKQIYRITYNEVTRNAIQEAINNPGQVNQDLVNAQQARRILDRLVGYQISPILWRTVRKGLSAGRVQSVAVRLICEREAEIEAFVPVEYWTITATLKGEQTDPFDAKLLQIGDEKGSISTYGFPIDEVRANEIVEDARTKQFVVKTVQRRERKRRPVPPFITSTLQQDAARKCKFTAKRTMDIAQKLYEGLEIGAGDSVGLITYMRTDSTRVADEAINEVRSYIEKTYGGDYLPTRPVHYRGKKGAQDAHEAIRPTSVERTPVSLKPHLSTEQYRLYDLIWKRFVASQMNPALLDVTTIDVSAGVYVFRATGSIIKFKGFMAVYMEGRDEGDSGKDEDNGEETILPDLKVGDILELLKYLPKQHFTKPPPRYTEATLVKELEEKEIGRPSTYADIISKIQERKYVIKEKGRFFPQDIGKLVNQLLIKGFPDIVDAQFTAKMEQKFDDIEDGKLDWVETLSSFYQPFSSALSAAPDLIRKEKKGMEEISDQLCDKCGRPMAIKPNRTGSKFLACTGYPECKNAKPINMGIDCPEKGCDGYLGERSSKRGKIFYGCSNYPDCTFVLWDKPVSEVCPECKSPFLLEKPTKAGGRDLVCYNKTCNNTENEDQPIEDELTAEVCDKCGRPMAIKTSRAGGKFLACTGYPECKNAKPINIGVDCPEDGCDGYLGERRSKRGRIFYGCSNYPDCRFVLWDKPVSQACPQCQSPFLLEKVTKSKGRHHVCYNETCNYSESLSD